MCFITVYC